MCSLFQEMKAHLVQQPQLESPPLNYAYGKPVIQQVPSVSRTSRTGELWVWQELPHLHLSAFEGHRNPINPWQMKSSLWFPIFPEENILEGQLGSTLVPLSSQLGCWCGLLPLLNVSVTFVSQGHSHNMGPQTRDSNDQFAAWTTWERLHLPRKLIFCAAGLKFSKVARISSQEWLLSNRN